MPMKALEACTYAEETEGQIERRDKAEKTWPEEQVLLEQTREGSACSKSCRVENAGTESGLCRRSLVLTAHAEGELSV